LLVTGGRGWYQEEGQPAQQLQVGDVVQILPNVKHWHGAVADSWFVHLAKEPDISGGPPVWFERVSDDEYKKLR
jgi:quercetin dioxygenase-like cupin family protein